MNKRKHTRITRAFTDNVTGRDAYVVCQALALATCATERFPDRSQARSDAADMRLLLDHLTERADFFIENAQRHLSRGFELAAE